MSSKILGYHLEWEPSGEVVPHDTDKSKEPGKQKPIWQDPSKEVAKIFNSATKTGISETGAGELDNMTFRGEGPPTWPPESYWRKRTYVIEVEVWKTGEGLVESDVGTGVGVNLTRAEVGIGKRTETDPGLIKIYDFDRLKVTGGYQTDQELIKFYDFD
ncbi:hypothetical protein C2G38_2170756 [Gigaspora rosea]|uniref:Uncharacterized protein n=1 Tax=Gigaspora rosea TaxID=44941 RepID=A0A397VX76_9GLOM|nr:hypothetical protein C2G38_2170756 [Gigaspora rosea]